MGSSHDLRARQILVSQIAFQLTGRLEFCLLLKMQILLGKAVVQTNPQIPMKCQAGALLGRSGGRVGNIHLPCSRCVAEPSLSPPNTFVRSHCVWLRVLALSSTISLFSGPIVFSFNLPLNVILSEERLKF